MLVYAKNTRSQLHQAACVCESLSLVQLCDPMDCILPGSSVHGILQARILEWVAISFSNMKPSTCLVSTLCYGKDWKTEKHSDILGSTYEKSNTF